MAKWDAYYNDQEQEQTISNENYLPNETDVDEISDTELAEFINRLSGIDKVTGLAKSEITYQAYNVDDVNDKERDRVYHVANASIQISRNCLYSDLYVMDIIFTSADDTELKLLWGRLQQHLKHASEYANQHWIFYINLLERKSVTQQTTKIDELLTAHIFNPLLCYLTREVPNQKIIDAEYEHQMQGGNIIRMLIPNQLLTYSLSNKIDTNELKGEVQRDKAYAEFLEGES